MKILPTSAARYLLPLAVVLAVPSAAITQPKSAKEILLESHEDWQARMKKIENYTSVQTTMGIKTELTFVREELPDGRTVFVPRGEEGAGGGMSNFYRMYPEIAERAELKGRESVDGTECHVIVINDFSGLDLEENMAMGERGDFVPKTGTLYVGTKDRLIYMMKLEGEITANGKTSPMTAVTVLSDYREVEGMLHPYRLHITATGLAAGMSEEDMEEARRGLADMEKNFKEMDPNQQAMVKQMLEPQMARLRKMLESGQFEIEVITTELRVNETLE